MLGKIEGSRKKGVTEDEMVGWHHGLNGRDLEQTLGDGAGQGKPGVLQFMESQRVRDLVTEYQEQAGRRRRWLRCAQPVLESSSSDVLHLGPVLTCLARAWRLRQTSGNEGSDPPALPTAAWLTELLGDRQPGFSPLAHDPLSPSLVP